jgi:ubiquinol-cytochrome c reductase cytochrome c1 subunit
MDKLRLNILPIAAFATFAFGGAFAAGPQVAMEPADLERNNTASLQRGARNFMNYCSGCHGAQYVRYNTIGADLELSEEQLIENLMFNAEKTFETIRSAMSPDDAQRWFGVVPPDMSLIARAKGVDYIYNFLKGFYVEEASPTGVNNLYLAGTSMPHVLGSLQGFREAVFSDHSSEDGTVTHTFERFEQVTPGSMLADEYDEFVRDTVNFLAYIAEPIRSERRKLGTWVLIYLTVFLVIARMLKKQIWKDVS